jgi:hypothetical protein
MWIAAGLTFYTGYAYLQAGLAHAKSDRTSRQAESGEEAPAVRREQRPA